MYNIYSLLHVYLLKCIQYISNYFNIILSTSTINLSLYLNMNIYFINIFLKYRLFILILKTVKYMLYLYKYIPF